MSVHTDMTRDEIKAELHRRNMSQRDLADATGIHENYISKSLAGIRRFQEGELEAIARVLAPEPPREGEVPITLVPILGDVPAGSFQPKDQRYANVIPVGGTDVPPRAYALKIQGDSMDLVPGAGDGSTVIIDPDDVTLWPGEQYVVRNADGETTFKEYREGPARLVPLSSNPAHREIMLGPQAVAIEGRVWGFFMRKAPRRAS